MKTKLTIILLLFSLLAISQEKKTIINNSGDTMVVVNQKVYSSMTFLSLLSGNFSEKTLSEFNPVKLVNAKLGCYSKFIESYAIINYGGGSRIYEKDFSETVEEITLTSTGFELKIKPLHIPIKHNLIEFYISGNYSYFWLLRKEGYGVEFSNNQGNSMGGSMGLQYSIYTQTGKLFFYCGYGIDFLKINQNKTITSIYDDTKLEGISFGLIFTFNKGSMLTGKNKNKLFKDYEDSYNNYFY